MPANEQQNAARVLPPGYRFNEFEIQDVIGGGGFGLVYRAWDHQLERTIAIKEFMPVSLAARADDLSVTLRGERHQRLFHAGLQSFMQEARLLARFNHPGLLHVLRFWEGNGTAYMGTLFYSGMTLKAWQSSQPQTINDAWIRQLLPPLFGAIGTIHQAGYLHRDISLDNIQIQDNQQPVLLDFGSARKEIGNLSDETEIMLKPGFAPLEQYCEESDGGQGPWTDIYALGAVLHTLIVGSPPPVSVVRSIEDSYQPLSLLRPQGYSPSLLNAIDRALLMDTAQRPQSVEEMAALIALPDASLSGSVQPVPRAAEPAAPAVEPSAHAAEPACPAVEPSARAAEPAAPAVEPGARVAEPTGPAVEPSARAAEPAAPTVEPNVRTAEPAGPAVEPSARAAEPAGPAVEPSARAAEPAAPAVEPSARAAEPAGPAVEPSARAAEPAAPAVEPGARAAEPAGPAVETSARAAEPAAPASRRRATLLLGGLALLAVAGAAWFLTTGRDAARPPDVVSSGTGAGSGAAAAAPVMATVYIRVNAGETLLLDGKPQQGTPDDAGYLQLQLAAGEYSLQWHSAGGDRHQPLKVDRSGTWLINPLPEAAG